MTVYRVQRMGDSHGLILRDTLDVQASIILCGKKGHRSRGM